jgi:predicted Zn finger-like uncharacterized protein
MIIECPHCLTRFRLDVAQLDSRSMLKCARCKRVFPAPGQSSPARSRPKQPPREENLSFSFDDDEDDDWQASELTPEDVSEERTLLNVSDDETLPGGNGAAPPAIPAAAPPVVLKPTPAAKPAPAKRAPRNDAEVLSYDDEFDTEDMADVDEDDGYPSGGISVRSVFVFLVLVVCAYGALTWTLLDDPDWAERLTQTLPLVGKEVRDRSMGQDVTLLDVRGRYERTKDGKLVFVVTGKAVNHSSESLRGVQVVSKLYDQAERPLDEQMSACGNPMEARITDLSIHQAAILRGIKPPPEFSVQPGGQCPFVAIFLDVPTSVGAFSTEVFRARRQA